MLLGISTLFLSLIRGSQKRGSDERRDSTVNNFGKNAPSVGGTMLDAVREHYLVIKWLGRSERSEVYLVRDRRHERLHTIKVFRKVDAENSAAKFVLPIRHEIQALSNLRHPHIVRLQYANEDDEMIYMGMEYCAGGPLSAVLSNSLHPLDEFDALLLLGQLLSAVDFMHGRGVSHRDITPDNVLLTFDGAIKLADFSLAFRPSRGTLHISSPPRGRSRYAAPEVLAVSPHQVISSYNPLFADMWSCGTLFYSLLTSRDPPIHEQLTEACIPPPPGKYPDMRIMCRPKPSDGSARVTQRNVSNLLLSEQALMFISNPTRLLLEAFLQVEPHKRVKAGRARVMCDQVLKYLGDLRREKRPRRCAAVGSTL